MCEAHHDGTPHWHLLLFMRPEDRNRVIGILQRYALTDDHEELVRDSKGAPPFTDFTPRFDWKEIDPAKGDAAGYLAKYIAKNIDGAYLDDDEEAGTAADEGALHAVAWASWWGIRTFQQIGGAPVRVWRELRRISNAKKNAELVGPGFTLWLENGQLQSCRSLPNEPDWELDGQPPAEQGQLDGYAVPEGDEDWPMLVELCGQVYLAQGPHRDT